LIKRVLIIFLIFFGGLFLFYLYPKPQKVSHTASVTPIPAQVLGEVYSPKVSPTATVTRKKTIVKLGIVVDDYASSMGTLSQLEKRTGKTFSTVSIFKQFGNENNYLVPSDLDYIKSTGKKLLIAWEPWNPNEGLNQSRDYLTEINAGAWDEYITKFALQIKAYGAPVILRFGHEMNGNWYPWGNRPAEYTSAYRRIYEIFKTQNESNVKWMWSINAENVPVSPISEVNKYYPGSLYVDAVGLDGFNLGTSQNNSQWRSFEKIFGLAYEYVLRYGKPITISEFASAEAGGDKAKWISDMARVLPLKMANIGEIVWFDLNKETDWRINSSPQSEDAWRVAF
jgi:beta-mannanase